MKNIRFFNVFLEKNDFCFSLNRRYFSIFFFFWFILPYENLGHTRMNNSSMYADGNIYVNNGVGRMEVKKIDCGNSTQHRAVYGLGPFCCLCKLKWSSRETSFFFLLRGARPRALFHLAPFSSLQLYDSLEFTIMESNTQRKKINLRSDYFIRDYKKARNRGFGNFSFLSLFPLWCTLIEKPKWRNDLKPLKKKKIINDHTKKFLSEIRLLFSLH